MKRYELESSCENCDVHDCGFCSEHWIENVIENGKYVKFEDVKKEILPHLCKLRDLEKLICEVLEKECNQSNLNELIQELSECEK